MEECRRQARACPPPLSSTSRCRRRRLPRRAWPAAGQLLGLVLKIGVHEHRHVAAARSSPAAIAGCWPKLRLSFSPTTSGCSRAQLRDHAPRSDLGCRRRRRGSRTCDPSAGQRLDETLRRARRGSLVPVDGDDDGDAAGGRVHRANPARLCTAARPRQVVLVERRGHPNVEAEEAPPELADVRERLRRRRAAGSRTAAACTSGRRSA